jgi:hypothetical protein
LSETINPLFLQGMKSLVLGLLTLSSTLFLGQNKELTADESIPIPKVAFGAKGQLQITASSNSSPADFDFLVGKWNMHNRHLNKRLANCHDWTEFDSSDVNAKILNGAADMDTCSTTEFPGVEGKLFEGLTLRLFDPKTRLWSLYWVASNTGRIDPPVVGSFDKNGVRSLFRQSHAQWQTDPGRLSLGRQEQKSPVVGPGLLAGRRQDMGMEFLQRI